MTPSQIDAVRESFRLVPPNRAAVAALFYERLFERDPSLADLFRGVDRKAQGEKLVGALAFVVRGLDRPDALLPEIEALARRHVAYGVAERDYETVGAALLDTLALGLGDAFDEEVRDAWAAAYALLSSAMVAAAREVDAPADADALFAA